MSTAKHYAGMEVETPSFFGSPRRRRWQKLICPVLAAAWLTGVSLALAEPVAVAETPGVRWTNGPWADSNFFPIGVWLQDPAKADQYRQAGINLYVGLWMGPTEEQLAALKEAGMWVICEQTRIALQHLNDTNIIGWMQKDEPDNGQSLGARFGFGSPISPETIIGDYRRMKALDASRPVLLDLGQAAAWDDWYGRGNRNHHPEDYPEYLKGCDIASFDIYPVNSENEAVSGKLWFVASGLERLGQWSRGKKTVWNCVECTAITNPKKKPTPKQVRAEAWMSLIHGSRGLIYFVHQFKPKSNPAALLDDPEMLAAVTRLNQQIMRLAPVLNSPAVQAVATVQLENTNVPVAAMIKHSGGATYLFAVGMRDGATKATFTLTGIEGNGLVEVLDENRTLTATNGSFSDHFDPWAVHLYRVPATDQPPRVAAVKK